MSKKEMEDFQAVLSEFTRLLDACNDQIAFMNEHNFVFEKQMLEKQRQVYQRCFSLLNVALSLQKVDEWTKTDTHITKDLIAFFKDNTVVLKNDCNFYATWLKKKILKED